MKRLDVDHIPVEGPVGPTLAVPVPLVDDSLAVGLGGGLEHVAVPLRLRLVVFFFAGV